MRFFTAVLLLWVLLGLSQLHSQTASWQQDSAMALAAHQAGVAHYKEAAYTESIGPYRLAISLRDRCYPQGHNSSAQSRYNLGQSYRRLEQLDSAAYYLEESNRLYAKLTDADTLRWIRTVSALALVYADLGDLALLSAAAARSTALAIAFHREEAAELAEVFYLAAQACHGLSAWEDMQNYAMQSLHYAQQAESEDLIYDALQQVASAYLAQENYQSALELFEQQLYLSPQLAIAEEDLTLLHYNYSLCLTHQGRYPEAERWIEKLAKQQNQQADSSLLGGIFHLRAYLATQSGHYALATTYFQQAMALHQAAAAWQKKDQLSAKKMRELAYLHEDRANLFALTGQLTKAVADYDCMITYLDRIRLQLHNQDSQLFISKRLRAAFQEAIHLRYQLHQQTQAEQHLWEAFSLAERAKAFSLLAAIQDSQTGLSSDSEISLRRRIARLERNPEQQQALATARLELARLQKLHSTAASELPRLAPDALIAYLKQRQLQLLEYAIGQEHSYVFHLQPEGQIAMYPLALDANFADEIQQFRQLIRQSAYKQTSLRSQQDELDMAHAGASVALWRKLIPKPLAKAPNAKAQLLIIPDGVLAYLPFSALLTEEVRPPLQYHQLPYLKNTWQISYSYSALYLLALSTTEGAKAKQNRNILALAPTFATTPQAQTPGFSANTERAFPGLLPLRYNAEEVQAICGLLPRSDAYIGPAANRLTFEQEAAKYRIIHLSSHALVNADDPKQSFIAFTQLGDSLQTEEVLYLNDLYNYSLSAELAVLSACETNLGEFMPGEGVLSLARAFAHAGVKATLTSLWKVDDEATKDFMLAYYKALQQGESRAAALHSAQHALATQPLFAHPYFWSAFTLYGNPDPIQLQAKATMKYSYWLLALLPLCALLFLWYQKRGSSQRYQN